MTAYYNEIDPYAAQWLRNLIAAGHIPEGEVDDRSILDVRADDLAPFTECHFFAGIGGWPRALALAGWRGPVWTGSCPCQPLSSAGQRRGHADERHLWPAFHALIAECRPATVLGEQVASKDGREWLSGIRADLEHLGYAVGAADIPAAGVGAPHIRQRLFWVADSDTGRRQSSGVADADGGQSRHRGLQRGGQHRQQPQDRGAGERVAHSLRMGRAARPSDEYEEHGPESGPALAHNGSATGGLADAEAARCEVGSGLAAVDGSPARQGSQQADLRLDAWDAAVWLPCLDGKARRTQPGVFPLVAGLPLALDGLGPISRVGALRGAGNAITPQAAAAFVAAFMAAR